MIVMRKARGRLAGSPPGSRKRAGAVPQAARDGARDGAGTVSWAAQIAGIWAALEAFHIHVGLAGAGLVFVSSTIVQLFPFWPGNLGIFQLGVAGPLVCVYAISTANAVAFSVGLQLVEGLLGVGLGLFFLAREGLSLSGARQLASAEEEVAQRPDVRPARSGRCVPDGLDVVAVRIEHERAEVALAVLGAGAGRADAVPAVLDGRGVEGRDGLHAVGPERDVDAARDRVAPEARARLVDREVVGPGRPESHAAPAFGRSLS